MSSTAVAVQQHAGDRSASRWETIGNFVVVLLYACVVLFTVRFHEKWADEAQAWLLARDLDLKTLFFHELRYEGHPGLWHTILWVAQRVFHARYDSIGYIGAAFAIAGVAVLVFKAPFPWYIRWPLAFTYFLVYQYAVIARPYTLLPLLCFLTAICFKDVRHPVRMTVVLVFMTHLILHGAILAACFGLLYLLEARKSWSSFDQRLRSRYFICAAVIVCSFIFLGIILKPTADNEEFVVKNRLAHLPPAVKQKLQIPSSSKKLTTIVSGAFLDSFIPSALFIAVMACWCYTRKRLLLFVLPMGTMIVLYSLVHGYAHHHGTVFVAAITALWIAWPSQGEILASTRAHTWSLRVVDGLMVCLCAVNIVDASVAIKRDYLYPYSGAPDAVRYLKSVRADHEPMFGLLYGVAAVQAYFDHNIFVNLPTTYFHHGLPLTGTYIDFEALQRIKPKYVVVYSNEPDLLLKEGADELTSRGYEIVHFSDGYYIYKQGVYQRESYFIFRRRDLTDGQTPLPSDPGK